MVPAVVANLEDQDVTCISRACYAIEVAATVKGSHGAREASNAGATPLLLQLLDHSDANVQKRACSALLELIARSSEVQVRAEAPCAARDVEDSRRFKTQLAGATLQRWCHSFERTDAKGHFFQQPYAHGSLLVLEKKSCLSLCRFFQGETFVVC